MEEEVTITKSRHAELLRAEKILDALRACGVDNWGGYDEAISLVED